MKNPHLTWVVCEGGVTLAKIFVGGVTLAKIFVGGVTLAKIFVGGVTLVKICGVKQSLILVTFPSDQRSLLSCCHQEGTSKTPSGPLVFPLFSRSSFRTSRGAVMHPDEASARLR